MATTGTSITARRQSATAQEAVRALLDPRSIALVGASSDTEKFSGQPLLNLVNAGFTGALYPVNRRGGTMNGIKVLTEVSELPEGIDVGLVMVPASSAIDAVGALADRGVTTAVVAVSGFAELGTAEGRRLQDLLASTGRERGIRLVGPNTNGIYNTISGVPIGYNYTHSLRLAPGKVGLISHSGAMLGGFLPLLEAHGQGISTFVSCGNEVDLTLVDYARYLLMDEATTVIALIMDGVDDGAEFRQLVAEAHAKGKAIVILKLGNSASGTTATQAHSSRLAGSAAAYRAVFDADGIVSVPSLETLALASSILADGRRPARPGVMVASTSGAGSIMMADALTDAGLTPPRLAPSTVELMNPVAGFAQVINPFDSGAAGSENESAAFAGLASDPSAGAFVSYLNPVPTLSWRRSLADATTRVAREHPQMPVIVISPAPLQAEEAAIYHEGRIPVVSSTLDTITVLKSLSVLAQATETTPETTDDAAGAAPTGIALSEPDSKRFLSAHGVVFPSESLATSVSEALSAAERIGFPVVLKAAGPALIHKTEHGLVSVGVGQDQLADEFLRLDAKGRGLDPAFEGVVVAQQIPEGVEAVIGITVDPDFGPMIMVGSGGVLTELLNDVAVAPAPLTLKDADRLLSLTKVDMLIRGFRGSRPADRDALLAMMVTVSEAAIAEATILTAVDINPVRVMERGAVALDALVIRKDA